MLDDLRRNFHERLRLYAHNRVKRPTIWTPKGHLDSRSMLRRGICGKRTLGADVHRGLGLLRQGNGGMEKEIRKDKTEKGPEKKEDAGSTKRFDSQPEKPLPGDCCGGGCNPCVWDIYYEQLEAYNNSRSGDGNQKQQSSS